MTKSRDPSADKGKLLPGADEFTGGRAKALFGKELARRRGATHPRPVRQIEFTL